MVNRRLSEILRVRFLVESDEQCVSDSRRGSTQVARRSHQNREQFLIARLRFFQIERDDVLTLHGHDTACGTGQGQRFGIAFANFFRVDDYVGRRGLDLLKVPLSLLAGRSGFAEVQPVDRLRHGDSSMVETGAV